MPKARWNGPFDALTPGGGILRPGDVVEVTARELESAHWEAVADSPPAAPKTPAPTVKTSEGGDD